MGELHYKTLREEIADKIRNRIINRVIKPGEKIVEMELANEFKTSRAPIREALRQLENEGLIEYVRNAGCSVREITAHDAYEIYVMRSNYEILAVKILHGKIPEETIANMNCILNKMLELTEADYRNMFILDNEFHEELIKMVQLPRLHKEWSELNYGNIITSQTKNIDKKAMIDRQYSSHKKLYDACLSGDCDEICTIIVKHYRKTIERLLEEQEVMDTIHEFYFPL